MASTKEWLNQKFREWEKTQGKSQSYFAFARFIGISQTALAAWMDGTAEPRPDDLTIIAARLGPEIYAAAGQRQPPTLAQDQLSSAMRSLPAGLRERFSAAILATATAIGENGLAPDSIEAKKLAVEVLARFGIKLTS